MKKLFLLISFAIITSDTTAQNIPQIGAEIWIEPGQSSENIDYWFKTLADQQLPVARIFVMWNFIQTSPDTWDWTLYDQAFRSAEQHGVKIQATLTAHHGPAFVARDNWYREQGGSIPGTFAEIEASKVYIEKTVHRYRSSSALENWWLMNEPGQNPAPDEVAMKRFKDWVKEKYQKIERLNEAWRSAFEDFESIEYHASWDANSGGFVRPDAFIDWHRFWREHLTWYMSWTASEIRKYDDAHGIHVNPHGIFDTYRLYELPEWRDFLTSLGASIHPAWHFGILDRDQFALGVSATCDIIRGSSDPNPVWVSELQGGPNIYSVDRALGPTKEDIAQWVWTGVGAGAEKVIFWCLNWRRKGGEAGEWTMLNYRGEPSDRLLEASAIAKVIGREADFFEQAKPVESGITIALSQASMDIGLRKDRFETMIPGRKTRAHIQSSLAWYEALSERGIPAEFKEMADYDWEGARDAVAILANAIAIPNALNARIQRFVHNGNTLIFSGLSGYFDEREVNVFQTAFDLEKVVGARVQEVKLVEPDFDISMSDPHLLLPAHMWKFALEPTTGKVIGTHGGSPVAISNRYGQGRAIWIAAQAGLGAWLGDNTALSELIDHVLPDVQVPFRFREKTDNVVLRTLQSGDEYLTVVTNGKTKVQQVPLKAPDHLKGELVYSGSRSHKDVKKLTLGPRETVVIRWK